MVLSTAEASTQDSLASRISKPMSGGVVCEGITDKVISHFRGSIVQALVHPRKTLTGSISP